MPWGTTFLEHLERRTRSPRFLLERVELGTEPGAAITIASHKGLGGDVVIGMAGVKVQGQSYNPYNVSSTVGAWSVDVVGDISGVLGCLTRGTFVRLRVGFEGMMAGQFEPVAMGWVANIRGRVPRWTIECKDLFSGLRQRPTKTIDTLRLFTNIEQSTTVAMTPGYLGSGTSLTVASTTGFQKKTGGSGLLLVTPTSGADPFFLEWTSATATVFTVVNSDVLGTTRVFASYNSTVKEVGYLYGHPLDIAREILLSTGTGTNGVYDLLPEEWGLSIRGTYVDSADIDRWAAGPVRVTSGTYQWDWPQVDVQDDAIGWLSGFLAPAGLFLAMRQGIVTVRARQNSATSTGYYSGMTIRDEDIEAIEQHEYFDPGHSTEYDHVEARTATGSDDATSANLGTRPCANEQEFDVSDRVFSNESAVRSEMILRLNQAATVVPERLVLRCAGLRLAQLSPGDICYLWTNQAYSRTRTAMASRGFMGAEMVVAEVSPDWTGGRCRLALLSYPLSNEDFPS